MTRHVPAYVAVALVRCRLMPSDPTVKGSLGVGFGVGVVAAFRGTALDAEPYGAGVLGGVAAAALVIAGLVPLLCAVVVGALVAREAETGHGQTMSMVGVQARDQLTAAVLYGCIVTSLSVPAALLGGALSGLGDALRQETSVWGVADRSPQLLFPALGALMGTGAGSLVGLLVRDVAKSISLICVGVITFFPLMYAVRGGAFAEVAFWLPAAGVWSQLDLPGIFTLKLSRVAAGCNVVGWTAVFGVCALHLSSRIMGASTRGSEFRLSRWGL